ncbi:MAG TPA: hypothetical protein PK022_06105 [Syntrophales bacterium]|nr:hypothetical protein [Syntrophales bacterium]
MLENTLDKLAEKILGLDEASLASLWDKFKIRMDQFDRSKEWEKAVIIFFIINAVRAKNHIFNEHVMKEELSEKDTRKKRTQRKAPELRIIK